MSIVYRPKAENIAATMIDGEAIIVNLTTGVYYSMDLLGAEVWGMLETGLSSDQIADRIAAQYEVSTGEARKDLDVLTEKLVAEDLIEAETESAATVAEHAKLPSRAPYAAPTLSIYRDMGDLLALDPPMPGLRDIPLQIELPPRV